MRLYDRASPPVDLTLSPSDALDGESIDSRNKVMDILLPLSFAWFRVRLFLSLSPLPFSQPIVPPHFPVLIPRARF